MQMVAQSGSVTRLYLILPSGIQIRMESTAQLDGSITGSPP